jgi:uncharacterized protein YfaS (alpha-2-macroglobulin family)
MTGIRKATVVVAALLLAAAAVGQALGVAGDKLPPGQKAAKEMEKGNYKDAYEMFRELALDSQADPKLVGGYLERGTQCLNYLYRYSEVDGFIEEVVKAQADNWRLLHAAARTYYSQMHYGTIVSGKFERGSHRGGGRYVNSIERDRARALQLMVQALPDAARTGSDKAAEGETLYTFYHDFAAYLLGYRGYGESWRLQYLSDLAELPDYEDGYGYYYYGRDSTPGAPVDADGNPVFHKLPASFEGAASDGERWRWLLDMAAKAYPSYKTSIQREFASFLHQQFGVQTIGWYASMFATGEGEGSEERSATWQLHTLAEDETIARLATGIKRFKLPDEFNFIRIFKEIGEWSSLASIFEDRRQYDTAAEYWKKAGDEARVKQILANWGQFEPAGTQAAGTRASIEYRFRNGTMVKLEAHEVKVKQLLDDVKAYLSSNPHNLEWEKVNIEDIGNRLVYNNQKQYIGKKVASWSEELKPRKLHFDTRTTLRLPLEKAGVYLVTATMDGGNTTKVIIWIDDTVIVKKLLNNATWLFVADAVTGTPIAGADVEFFGYKQEYHEKRNGEQYKYWYDVHTKKFSRKTDDNGQIVVSPNEYSTDFSWVLTARPGGRLAYLGFTGIWYGSWYDYEYNETKTFGMTDRPVYRPNQPVRFKFWVREAKYDVEDRSAYAERDFRVVVYNPKGEKFWEKDLRSDKYAGFGDEFMLPDEAPLGLWSLYVDGWGGTSFRVEEYKKPEFEVTVEAPTEPVMLGEKVEAKVKAKYYFGAPVTKAKVKYKVLRSDYSANWYPWGWWDWLYGSGYWWFVYDYVWYPGWRHWGFPRPHWWWWPVSEQPPEVVAEAEVQIGEDGEIRIPIDTALAKELHGDKDHRYEITAEVTDQSRRVIVGTGQVLVARNPFKVYAWVDRGHYRVADVIQADFQAQTLDGRGVKGEGELRLLELAYENGKPVEKTVQEWSLATGEDGRAGIQLKASKAAQYRLSYKVTDAKKHTIEGGYIFVVMGEGSDNKEFRFNEVELVPDKKEYEPGEKVRLLVNTDRQGSTVLLFVRPSNGVYLQPKTLKLDGKSAVEAIEITKKDMPNFFVEALTISDGKVFSETREILVPPEKRVINVEVLPSADKYKPGEKAKVRFKLTDYFGKPVIGSVVVSVYDKSVEYISGGSNVPEIKSFFWKWRRSHYPATEHSLNRSFYALIPSGELQMLSLGAFGHLVADESASAVALDGAPSDDGDMVAPSAPARNGGGGRARRAAKMSSRSEVMAAPAEEAKKECEKSDAPATGASAGPGAGQPPAQAVQPTVRKAFADTAFWAAALESDREGIAEVEFDMPENLTGWKIRTWAMGAGTRVGEGTAEVVTVKNLLLRLQAPRFFVQKDEVVLSANIHNYLEKRKTVQAVLELDGGVLEAMDKTTRTVEIDPKGEARVDWRVKVINEGEAIVRMKALTDEESDAMEMRFPAFIHGMLKTESYCGVIRPHMDSSRVEFSVPEERRIEQSLIELRYSPTLAAAMVDALPYLVDYPYGCTEQTLNRFLPTVITQNVLKRMGQNLKAIQEKRTNLNAQEIGDDKERAKQWQRWLRNPVFDEGTVNDMVKTGVRRLTAMQLSDGGWGWFSGWGEYSYPHTTATVIHGLQIAVANGVKVDSDVIHRGVAWLQNYQQDQIRMLKNAPKQKDPWKDSADSLDALIYMVLADAGKTDKDMRDFLYRDRTKLPVYAKSLFGMGLHRLGEKEKLAMIIKNIDQYLVEDQENQSAYLKLEADYYWWYWYGSEFEAQAYYLKLLAATDPKSDKAAGLVKYLLNNRKHATYWNSTRDTALCIEALADYLVASGEDKPDMTLEIWLDGTRQKEVRISSDNLFTFDNKLILAGQAVTSGKHKLELKRKGKGPVYFNAYVTNFTLEDFITKAGLEIKVQRKYYKLVEKDKTMKVSGSRGQALDQKVEKFERQPIENLAVLKSGELVEIELEIDSKNDYEYIVFEDMKPAGFEPVEVRSGYNGNDMGAYVEFRDERVVFFVRWLARGSHSVAYRMRAEIPGKFSALPTRASAMYAPELKANSDEIKLGVED